MSLSPAVFQIFSLSLVSIRVQWRAYVVSLGVLSILGLYAKVGSLSNAISSSLFFCSFLSFSLFLNSNWLSIAYCLLYVLPWVSKDLFIFHSFSLIFFGLISMDLYSTSLPSQDLLLHSSTEFLFQFENFYLVLFIHFISLFRFPACSLFNTKISFYSFNMFSFNSLHFLDLRGSLWMLNPTPGYAGNTFLLTFSL